MSLLGDLFQEEGEGSFPDQTLTADSGNACGSGANQFGKIPVSSRPTSGLCGIYNQGATCYLNSLLQTLVMTPEFREALFQVGMRELGKLEDVGKPEARVRVIPIQLQRLFARLLLLDAQGALTDELTESFGWKDNEGGTQHDAQELNRILFSAIEDSLVATSGQDLIRRYYHGSIVNQIICQECGRVSEREEDFLDLCIAVAGVTDLASGLQISYIETEQMSGKNQYRCEACRKLVDAKKGAKLRRLPPILTISLLRFSYDFQKMERYKEIGKFVFPSEIDMSPYCESLLSTGNADYELFSVVIHRGSTHGGHYHAFIRDIDGLGRWTHPEEEEIVLPMDPATGKVDVLEFDSPIELVQALLNRGPKDGMQVDKLCGELAKQTGVSWNKRFKKNWGPVNKFLKKHDEIFDFDQGSNWVSLKDCTAAVTTDVSPVRCRAENSPMPDAHQEDNPQSSDRTQEATSSKKSSRPLTPAPEPGHCWFDFDDSRIRPILARDLEKQFLGKESAYMLFYRQKGLRRPKEAFANPAYNIAEDLITDILRENEELRKERKAFEIKINTIYLQIHFDKFYTFRDGGLRPLDECCSFLELEIDRRQNVADLKIAVMEIGGDLVPENFVISIARTLPAGLHPYESLSGNDDCSIMSTVVGNNSKLFIWDGAQVAGQLVPVGESCEAIWLTVTYGNPSQFQRGFSKNLTVGEFRAMLEEDTLVPVDRMQLTRMISKGDESKLLKVSPDDDGKSLEELKVSNGEQFIVEDVTQSPECEVAKLVAATQAKQMSFIVENRLKESLDGSFPVIPVQVEKDMNVGELKAVILSQISPTCDAAAIAATAAAAATNEDGDGDCRLRLDDDNLGLRPPLHEDQALLSCGLQQGMRLVLEKGTAPQSTQMTLGVTVGYPGSDRPDLEVIVDKQLTVQDCMSLVMQKAGLQGDAWHLRKTNWCGEPAGLLDDLDVTLSSCQLRDGEHLLLEEGKLPPAGYLKLQIWLYPSPEPTAADSSRGLLSWVSSGIQGLLSKSSEGSSSAGAGEEENALPASVGEVIISKEATLEELKMQIMTLPQMELAQVVPMPSFLRVRLVEQKHLTTVLRDPQQTLQRLKLGGVSQLAVQVLSQEENLGPNDLLLNVQQRIAGSRNYLPPQELLWKLSQSATVQGIRQSISDLLHRPMERLAIAKHFEDQFEWLILQDSQPSQVQRKNHKSNKRKGKAKVNLKQAPYHLKDGDCIGVKDLEFHAADSDFSTPDDDAGVARRKQEAEEKKHRREELRKLNASYDFHSGGDHGGKGRQEVGIKIHVGDFT